MSRMISILTAFTVLCLSSFELSQVFAACKCMCYAVSGKPETVTAGPGAYCHKDYSYTYNVHFATNNDNCTDFEGWGWALPVVSGSCNIQEEYIDPEYFYMNGDGETVTFECGGQLLEQDEYGKSLTRVWRNGSTVCDTGNLEVKIFCDADCPGCAEGPCYEE